MPTYVYQFEGSGERVEVSQSIFDPALIDIDGCPVRRVPVGGIRTDPFVGRFSTKDSIQRFFETGDPEGL